MALKQYQSTYGGRDLKMGAMLTDPEGGTATYASKIDASAVQDFSYTVSYKVIEVKGDDVTRAVKTVIDKLEGSFKVGKGCFELDAILMGGTAGAVTGSAPNQTQSYTQTGTQSGKYFELEFQEMDVEEDGTGDLHTILHKCRVTSKEVTNAQDAAKERTYNFQAIPRDSDGFLYTKTKNETAVAIVTTSDTTAPTISSATYADGATAVPVGASFSFTFSEALDPRTINSDNIFIQNRATGTLIACNPPSLSPNGLVVTIQPSANLAAATAHQVILLRAITDLARNKMAAHAIYDFTTA